MAKTISTWMLPTYGDPAAVSDRAAVVIDVLRASTTIITALAQGAAAIYPCVTIDEGLTLRQRIPDSLAGGERGGLPIPGFDFGNSPGDYTAEQVAGRDLIFTTTNGTRALNAVATASWVGIGAFVNVSALVTRLIEFESILLVCAGTDGRVTREDVLFAGCLVRALQSSDREEDDSSRLARQAWCGTWGTDAGSLPSPAELVSELELTQGGRNLRRLGLAGDLQAVASIDSFAVVPQWFPGDRTLRLA